MTAPVPAVAAVIGAGVMGAQIAAQFANAGLPVKLLDVTQEAAEAALRRLEKMQPAPLMSKRAARLITPGGMDNLASLAECAWVVEAVVERLEVKQALYAKLAEALAPTAFLSSNTSTIPLAALKDGMQPDLAARFCITHFFNPPRYMRLVEIVGAEGKNFAPLRTMLDEKLGKEAIACHDRPGFIANRIGTYWLQCAMGQAQALGLSIEEADAVMGRALGFPSTGVFGLVDLVGLDIALHVGESLARLLPPQDAFFASAQGLEFLPALVAAGQVGDKAKGGFYRSSREASGKKHKQVLELSAAPGELRWREAVRVDVPGLKAARRNLAGFLAGTDKYALYAQKVLHQTLDYAASLVPEISDNPADIDMAMRLGYNWEFGPFELMDRLGLKRPPSLPRPARPGVVLLADIKAAQTPLLGNKNASVWDLGDGVLCFELHAEILGRKLNMLDDSTLLLLRRTLGLVAQNHKALVIHNDDPRIPPQNMNFCAGANIGLALLLVNLRLWDQIEDFIRLGQDVYQELRYAPFPVVGAPVGRALGGGAEMLLHCAAVQAYAESYIGLVEAGVGVVPAWGGCTTLLARGQADTHMPRGPMPAVAKAFETISTATVARSAAEAKELHFLAAQDGITMNRDRVLVDAKAKALALVEGYAPPAPPLLHLPGEAGRIALQMAAEAFARRGVATAHDLTIATMLAGVLSGGAVDVADTLSEGEVMKLERDAFMALLRFEKTQARIASIVNTGKPLRN